MIYLRKGFWNGFLPGQTCEVPATARGNHFRPFVCLDNLHMFICCTGTGLLVQERSQEQKMAETVLADFVIREIHWHWVVPAYLPPEVFIFGEGSGMVSCLAKREVPATARGNHFRPFVCLDSLDSLDNLDSLDSLDMFICCTGTGLPCTGTKDGRNSFSWLDYISLKFICLSPQLFPVGEKFYLPICRPLHPLGPFFQRCRARQYLTHGFSELDQKQPNACKSLANARTFSTRDFAASCDTTCKSHFMCASGDGERSTQKKKDMHCCGECKGKGTANHFEAELNPQVPPVRNALTRDQEKNWTVNLSIFYRVSVYNPFGFLCQIALVRPYCCDIVQIEPCKSP